MSKIQKFVKKRNPITLSSNKFNFSCLDTAKLHIQNSHNHNPTPAVNKKKNKTAEKKTKEKD